MEVYVKSAGALFGLLSVILGAFAAHRLKRMVPKPVMESMETGIRYMMYHAAVLLILGFNLNFDSYGQRMSALCLILGVFLFSFSIFGLCWGMVSQLDTRFLGPVTPIGGLFLIVGWVLLLVQFASGF